MTKRVIATIGVVCLACVLAAPHDSKLGDEFNTVDEHQKQYWDYKKNGDDWGLPTIKYSGKGKNECGSGKNQSPIDLKTSWPTKSAAWDRFQRVYTNQVDKIKVYWNGHTSQVPVDKTGQDIQTFYSINGNKTFGAPNRFNGVQFHFHSGSEHTIDGQRYDLEMHTVHLPYDGEKPEIKYSGFIAAAQGIMFDTTKASRSFEDWEIALIDEFFDNLRWDVTTSEPVVPIVTYGKLMQYIDMKNRYTYVGSVTTPPCATKVYWNVQTTIYPLKPRHLQQFKNQLAREKNLEKYGNYRNVLAETPGHNPVIMKTMGGNTGMLIVLIILALVSFALLVLVIKYKTALDEANNAPSSKADAAPAGTELANVEPSQKENVA